MTLSPLHKKSFAVLTIACLLFIGFALGFISCLRLKSGTSSVLLERQLLHSGDASPEVHAQVLQTLRAFQEGYARRDPHALDAFMLSLFPSDEDILLLGTESGASEWAHGYSSATEFIRRDWQQWGDVRLDVDHADVWSMGDAAWLVTVGSVKTKMENKPIRLTAILTRRGDRWVFRQLQFQLDQSSPQESDVLNLHTYTRLARLALVH